MKEIGRKVFVMVKVPIFIQLQENMKVIGEIIKNRVRVFIILRMETDMRAICLRIRNMELDHFFT